MQPQSTSILTVINIRQESVSEPLPQNRSKDLLPTAVQWLKWSKPHTEGLDDTAIPQIKIKITKKKPLEKNLITKMP